LSRPRDIKLSKDTLREPLRFETLLTRLAALFINLPSAFAGSQIERGLRLILDFLGMDRGMLALFGEGSDEMTTVWGCTVPGAGFSDGAELKDFRPWPRRSPVCSAPVFWQGREDLPEEAVLEREYWERTGTRVGVLIPIRAGSTVFGTGVFLSRQEAGPWPADTAGKLTLLGEILANVFGRMRAEEQNVRLLSFEKLLSRISTELINLPGSEIDGKIRKGLEAVVKFLGVERGTVFEFSADKLKMNRTHSWTEEGILSSPERYTTEGLPWTAKKLQKGDLILVEKIDDLPAEAAVDKQLLQEYRIKSAIMVPMMAGGSILGSVVVSTITRETVWPRQLLDRLKVIGDIFAGALARKEAEKSLHAALKEVTELKEQLEAENVYLRKEIKTGQSLDKIIGRSVGLRHVFFRASQVAGTDATVLILGETGTGKELIAHAIHDMSPRKDRPLITVNCATLPSELIESELFGHEKGAFTGADTRQTGRFETAHNSTLCLDEIGELPLKLQAKLLRVVQHGEFERLGSPRTYKVDVRILATTNRNLEEEVRRGRFREDLFYRLNVFPIMIPPLRDRREDIPLLVEAFVAKYGRKQGKKITSIAKETMAALLDYPWPGNIRELESVIERSVILCPGPVLRLADKLTNPSCVAKDRKSNLQDVEREHILNVLSESRWRVEGANGAAAVLGLHPSTLRSRMRKLGINK
jgi:transcriptional regulator with GAF, ATPase, and Fis domain